MMEVKSDEFNAVAEMLIGTGLAEGHEYGYIRFDPALPLYLKLGQAPERLLELETVWAGAMLQLVHFLMQQRCRDNRVATRLTLLDLPNLLALLDWLEQRVEANSSTAETTFNTAASIEQILATLTRPQALSRAVAVREKVAAMLPAEPHTHFENEKLLILRLLQQDKLQQAHEKALALLANARAVGPKSYGGADYDLATATYLLGSVLLKTRQSNSALELFVKAQQLFETLGKLGEHMAATALASQGNCLLNLGRLDKAVETYKERVKRAEKLKNLRQVALGKRQLSTVLTMQGRHTEAIAGHEEARTIFEQQNEENEIAVSWHQIGSAHQVADRFDEAEKAYRCSLELMTRTNDRAGQASCLGSLGYLYNYRMNRPEEALSFYQQAVDIIIGIGDLQYEGNTRNNISDTLCMLKRYDEARVENLRAIECDSQFGHTAEPWKTFYVLQKIEAAAGDIPAARAAWQQARTAYLAYRQQGGYAQSRSGKLCDQVLSDILQGSSAQITQELEQLSLVPDTPEFIKLLISKLLQITDGSRTPVLADDPALDYGDSAEIIFLIERLEA